MQRQNNWRRHSGRGGGNNRSSGNRGGRGGGRQNNMNTSKNPLRQQMDSNGPLGRVRGNAMQIMDKYLMMAKETMSDGDRVLTEACLQYADHYQRFITEHQGQFKPNEDEMGGDGYGEMESVDFASRQRSPRASNGDGGRVMGRGVVRYLDDDNDGGDGGDGGNDGDGDGDGNSMGDDKDGEDLPSFLTGSQRGNGKRKMNDDGAE